MAYARTADEQYDFVAATPKPSDRGGIFRRLFAAMVDARQRAVEREVAAYLQGCGHFLTDDAEREIERILSSSARL